MRKRESPSWPEQLFVNQADMVLRVFKYQKGTDQEVKGLTRVFSEFRVKHRSRILDIPCGAGRHSVELAKKGYSVTGVDFSDVFIEKASTDARKLGVANRAMFLTGDTRTVAKVLSSARPFSVILSLWSSIGYYGRDEDARLFKALRSFASSNCLLIVDTVNRDSLILRSGQRGVTDMGSVELHEKPELNLENSNVENVWRFYEKRGGNLRLIAETAFAMRCYSLHEVKELLESSGWRFVKSYGSFDLEPFTRESRRMILCCRRS